MQSNNINERTTLLRRNSLRVNYEADTGEVPKPMAGGTVLGIHNLAIVFPQFVVSRFLTHVKLFRTSLQVAIVASLIFRIADAAVDADPKSADNVYYGRSGVGWVLLFGGMSAFVRALQIYLAVFSCSSSLRLVPSSLVKYHQLGLRRRCVDVLRR